MSIEIHAVPRNNTGKMVARRARREGFVPGVCYGKKIEPFGLNVAPEHLTNLLYSERGRNSVAELVVGGQVHHVMIQDIQRDPVKRSFVHVDFRVVTDEDIVVVEVPVRTLGKAKGEEIGGRLVPVRRTVGVRCQVKDIPADVEHDVSELEPGQTVLASNLTAPESCEIVFKSDFVVLHVVLPRGSLATASGEEEAK